MLIFGSTKIKVIWWEEIGKLPVVCFLFEFGAFGADFRLRKGNEKNYE